MMKEQFVGGTFDPKRRSFQRIGFIFTEANGGTVRDIAECDPLPGNFSMMKRFLKTWEGCDVTVYVTSDSPSCYSEQRNTTKMIPNGCRLPRLCIVLSDGAGIDLEKWFFEKCKELYPQEASK